MIKGSPAISGGELNRHCEGVDRASGNAAGHGQTASAGEAQATGEDGARGEEYSIAAVFSELALVAKLEAASSRAATQDSAGVLLDHSQIKAMSCWFRPGHT